MKEGKEVEVLELEDRDRSLAGPVVASLGWWGLKNLANWGASVMFR